MLNGVELVISFALSSDAAGLRLVGASRRFLNCSTTVRCGPGRDLVMSIAVNETNRLPSFEVLRLWKLITLFINIFRPRQRRDTHSKLKQAIPSWPSPAQPLVQAVSCSGVTGPIRNRFARW